jgi:hypothetical protein
MFGIDWGSSQTILVNLTNLGLGVVVAVLVGIALVDVIRDLAHRH